MAGPPDFCPEASCLPFFGNLTSGKVEHVIIVRIPRSYLQSTRDLQLSFQYSPDCSRL